MEPVISDAMQLPAGMPDSHGYAVLSVATKELRLQHISPLLLHSHRSLWKLATSLLPVALSAFSKCSTSKTQRAIAKQLFLTWQICNATLEIIATVGRVISMSAPTPLMAYNLQSLTRLMLL